MERKLSNQNAQPPKHPHCELCRNGTYAVMAIQVFDRDDSPWSPYCDECGASMLSVIRDSSQREATTKRLPTPPKATEPVLIKAVGVVPTPKVVSPVVVLPPVPTAPPHKVAAEDDEPYDLLTLLGLK